MIHYFVHDYHSPVIGISDDTLHCVKIDDMWGYADKNGDIVIPAQYKIAYPFYNGCAIVMRDGYYGVIDMQGEAILPFEYHKIFFYAEEMLFVVSLWNKKGVVDINNDVVIPMEYDSIIMLSHKVFRVSYGGRYGVLSCSGDVILPVVYDTIRRISSDLYLLQLGEAYGLTTLEGRTTALIYDYISIGKSDDNLICVKLKGKWGVINNEFRSVIPAIYSGVLVLSETTVAVRAEDGEWYVVCDTAQKSKGFETMLNKGLKHKAMPLNESMIIFPILENIPVKQFISHHLYFPFEVRGGELYFIKSMGHHDYGPVLVPMNVDDVLPIVDGNYIVVRCDGKYGVIDRDGSYAVPCKYDKIRRYYDWNYCEVLIDGKWGVVDVYGHQLLKSLYDNVQIVNEGYYAVTLNGKNGCVGTFGDDEVSIPCKYEHLCFMQDGKYIAACLEGKWGIVDIRDNIIVPFLYDRIYETEDRDTIGLENARTTQCHLLE